jgi:hypothetical protein
MSDIKQDHRLHERSDSDSFQKGHRPYWKGAHRDWRVWLAVFFIFVAMFIYVMSNDFAFLSRSRSQTPPSGAVGK